MLVPPGRPPPAAVRLARAHARHECHHEIVFSWSWLVSEEMSRAGEWVC
ncbi:hypothetical protein [Streptomyces sp. NPDC001811]